MYEPLELISMPIFDTSKETDLTRLRRVCRDLSSSVCSSPPARDDLPAHLASARLVADLLARSLQGIEQRCEIMSETLMAEALLGRLEEDLDWAFQFASLATTDEVYGRLRQALRQADTMAVCLQKIPGA